jgi:anthranilate phosphoribosyltransferase
MKTQPTSGAEFGAALSDVVARRDLDAGRMRAIMGTIFAGQLGDAEVAALLVALHMKGETQEELAAAAAAMREHMVPLETGRADVLDTCGTGGDGSGTFNISTATALVVAGCGVPVVKHGNRAVSSRAGSADVLEALGVPIGCDAATCRRCLDSAGMAFCLAPKFHPAMKHVGAVRRRLGVRTLFNCLGPLANPARAPYQLLGVARPEWLDRLAGALARLGTSRAFLVCGRDGLDEVTLSSATMVREVHDRRISTFEWTPDDFGLEACTLDELRVATSEESAAVIRRVLEGEEGAALRITLANVAAALLVVGRAGSLPEGVSLARAAIAQGRAKGVLEQLRAGQQ